MGVMSFRVRIGSLGATLFFQVGLCMPLQTMEYISSSGSSAMCEVNPN